eukprot:COSAG05_NODE_881_length_6789_cov_21.387743_4_plen_139_part_00
MTLEQKLARVQEENIRLTSYFRGGKAEKAEKSLPSQPAPHHSKLKQQRRVRFDCSDSFLRRGCDLQYSNYARAKMHGSDIQALLVSQGGGSSGLSREQQVLGRAQLLDEREKELEAREAQQADLATRYHPVYSTRVLK